MAVVRTIPAGAGRVVLLVVAHADDVALFLGGTVAAWSDAGWRVAVVRVTDDRTDSVGLTEAATIAANHDEFRRAAAILGVDEIVELGYRTDALADISEVVLREQIIRQVRRLRPYALVTFDPDARHGEDNEDHRMVARATDEAFWTSQFDQHHPEHLAEGLAPHGCFERWYFGRQVVDPTDVVDIAATLDRKIDAACEHVTMMTNYANQLVLQARTGGWDLPFAETAAATSEVRPLLEPLLRAGASRVGATCGMAAGEEFRVVTFGGMQALLDRFGTRRS
ncbi:MAG: PIG-L family deacetylase [Actinobacteria bacterium]|nr:PIG-L family deacetylase [Actinomycetota bacterium]